MDKEDLRGGINQLFVKMSDGEKLGYLLSRFNDDKNISKGDVGSLLAFLGIHDGQLSDRQSTNLTLLSLLDNSEARSKFSSSFFEFSQLCAGIIDRFFDPLTQDPLICEKTQKALLKLKPALWQLAMSDSQFLLSQCHPARLYLGQLLCDATTCAEDVVSRRNIQETIDALLSEWKTEATAEQINLLFDKQLRIYRQTANRIKRRSLIFERRTCESELGRAMSWAAKFWASRRLSQILDGFSLPEFIQEMMLEHWVHSLYLDRLKFPDMESPPSLKTVEYLMVSLQEVFTQESVGKLAFLQLKTREKIEAELEHLLDSPIKRNSFMQQLLQLHQDVLAIAKQKKPPVTEPEDSDIIRLSPASNAKYRELPELHTDTFSRLPKLTPEELEAWVEEIFAATYQLNEVSAGLPGTELTNHPVGSDSLLRTFEKSLIPGAWYQLEIDARTVMAKLSTKLIANDSYVFVDAQGAKVKTINEVKLYKLSNLKKLQPVNEYRKSEIYFQQAISPLLEKETSRLVKLAEAAKKQEQERLQAEAEKQKQLQYQENFKRQNQAAIEAAEAQLSELKVGAWLEHFSEGRRKKCRLAAKLQSGEQLVLVDRNGLKFKQATLRQLAEDVAKGELVLLLDNELFDLSLR